MQSPEDNHNHNHNHHHRHSDVELPCGDEMSSIGPLSGPLNKSGGGKKNARFSLRDDNTTAANDCVEITDSAVVHKAAGGGAVELTLPATGPEKKSSLVSNASSRIRQVLQELRRSRFLTRRPQPAEGRFDRSKSAAAHALKGLKFISETEGNAPWTSVEKRFKDLTATTNGLLPRSLFGECIGMYKKSDKEPDKESGKKFADKLFVALARERNITGDCITKAQLEEFWSQITNQSSDCRLQAFFDMVDENGDGRITKDEVKEVLILSASANKLSNIQKQADEYAALLVEVLDVDKDGYITIEELKMLLLQDTNQSGRSDGESRNLISKMLSENLTPTQEHPLKKWYKDFQHFFHDHWRRVWVMALWIGVMAGLFAYKYVQYRNRAVFDVMGHCVCMAKGAAETLKLNMALILLPMCRNTITWLRNKTRLGMVVPFDDNINFHKMIAAAVAIGIGIHGISHLACDFPRLLNASPKKYKPMEQFFGDQPTSYWHFVKGWEGVTGILMVVLMAIAFTLAFSWFRTHKMKLPKPLDKVKSLEPLNKRLEKMKLPEPLKKLTGFNAFWYSHHLFIIVYALLIIHGMKLYFTHEWYKKTTWMYLAIPITLYAGERLIRAFRSTFKDVKILKVTIYSGNVLALQMSKSQNFRYESGEYIFVNCAAVSPFEWHPFSITSAPGDDHLSVHIKRAGDWTKQLIDDFSKFCQPPPSGDNGILVAQGENIPNSLKVQIDGPYGAPTQDYKDYDVVLLVGLGIGATPMISVVKDIINNVKDVEEKENALEEGLPRPSSTPKQRRGCGSGQHNFKTRKAYFYWMTREQGSFDWFKGLMNDVAEIDHRGVIEMHNYCTSVYKKGDFRCALIAMLQTINLAKEGVDIVSGSRIKTDFGRPDWRKVYEEIEANHPNSRVGVFYCGASRELVKDLKQLASDFSHKTTTTTTTKFEFHKENF